MRGNFYKDLNQPIDAVKAKESFIKDFKYVKSQGFYKSHRSHNTGIGKTFEDVMEIEENNLQIADYQGCIELKSQRDYTQSMITLFTKSPSYPNNANTILRQRYGSLDPESGYNILHTTMVHSKYNTFMNVWGFKLQINQKEERIEIKIKSLGNSKLKSKGILPYFEIEEELENNKEKILNNIENFLVYYSFNDLKKKISEKCSLIAYILAETKREDDIEYFHFIKATLLSNLTFEKFLSNIRNDIIKYDIRLGAYRSGINKGKTHDHGSGFRVKKENLPNLFDIEEIN